MSTLTWSDALRLLADPTDAAERTRHGRVRVAAVAGGIALLAATAALPPTPTVATLTAAAAALACVACGWLVPTRFAPILSTLLAGAASVAILKATPAAPLATKLGIVFAAFFIAATLATLAALLRASLDEATVIAEHDRMTGLVNRAGFVRRLHAEANRSRRSGWPIAIGFLDLDRFKRLNDTRGHAAGDAALQLVAETLAANVRNYDTVARFGGDEFAVLWPVQSAAGADTAGHRLHETLSTVAQSAGFDVGVSLGLAVFEAIPDDPSELLERADELMYEAKQSGRGRVVMKNFNDATGPRLSDDRR